MPLQDKATEREGFFRMEDFSQGLGSDIAQDVLVLLVVAAGEDVAVGGDDTTRPEAEARRMMNWEFGVLNSSFFMDISAIGCFVVASVVLVGRHKRIAVLKVVELGSFED